MFDFEKQVNHVGGWLTKDEGNYLYEAAKKVPKNGIIVEIGSWKGRSTVCLGKGVQDGNRARIYAVDPHNAGDSLEIKKAFNNKVDTYKEFLDNIKKAGVSEHVTAIKDTSENFAKKSSQQVNFVFIDGSHEYEFVKKDFELWFPKLKKGGLMTFHDCWHAKGVQLFTARILFSNCQIRKPNLIDTITIIEKTEKDNLLERFQNIIFIIYRLLFGWIGVIKINYYGGKG